MLVNSVSSSLPSSSKFTRSLDSNKNTDLQQSSSSEDSENSENSQKTSQTTASEQRELQKLKAIDREVRAHELAHISVGGRYITSGAQFSYQKGPDGQLYAVGGDVSIDTAKVPGDPRATLLKAQVVVRAALAPANPSAQDKNVAAQATVLIQQARIDLSMLSSEIAQKDIGQNLDAFA